MDNAFFVHQIKRTKGTFDKGIAVKPTYNAAKQGYHAYLGAYAYGNNADTDFASVAITDMTGAVLMAETWAAVPADDDKDEAGLIAED